MDDVDDAAQVRDPGVPGLLAVRPSIEPIRAQRRVAATGVILVTGQRVSLGRAHAGQTITDHASETTLAHACRTSSGTEQSICDSAV